MPNTVTGARDYDSTYMAEAAYKELKITSSTYAPAFARHMVKVSECDSIAKIADHSAPSVFTSLSAPYTAGSGSVTLAAISLFNNYNKEIVPGYTELGIALGAKYRITTWDPTTRVAGITLLNGTDVNLTTNQVVSLTRHNTRGDIANAGEDSTFGGGDFNYWSYFNMKFSFADDLLNKAYKVDINEYTLDHQVSMNLPVVYNNFENKIWHDFRSAGNTITGTGRRIPDGTNQGGQNSRAGGIIPLARARGLLELNLGGAPISMNFFNDLSLRLAQERGAWGTVSDVQTELMNASGLKNAIVYIDPALISEPSKLATIVGSKEAIFDVSDKVDGILGVKTRKLMGDEVLYNFIPSNGFRGSNAAYIVTEPSDIEIRVHHFMDDLELSKRGAFTETMCENSFTTLVSCPWRQVLMTNIGKFS
jgi:hypothetical protein